MSTSSADPELLRTFAAHLQRHADVRADQAQRDDLQNEHGAAGQEDERGGQAVGQRTDLHAGDQSTDRCTWFSCLAATLPDPL